MKPQASMRPHRNSLRKELGYLDDTQVAEFLGIEVPTLKNRRSRGDAPVSSKVGQDRLTTVEDLHRFVARRKAVVA